MSASLLVVDDNPSVIQIMATFLAEVGQVRFATNATAALEQMRIEPPDLVLLDAEMPGMSGFQLCMALKAERTLSGVPVMFVTAHNGKEFELAGLEAGAVDFVSKPFSRKLLLARVRTQLRLKSLTDELKRQADVDGLTGIANRRAFDTAFEREWLRARRSGAVLSVILLDVDYFKRYNDHYGHLAGDACLKAVSHALKDVAMRPGDLVARYGGEEFAILLSDTTREGARHVTRVAVDAIAALKLPHAVSEASRYVSVSAGVAHCVPPRPLPGESEPAARDRLLAAADTALYAAKHGGRAQGWWLEIGTDPAMQQARRVDAE
jgi:diguanylate cyclase (GGDEF)-like protein